MTGHIRKSGPDIVIEDRPVVLGLLLVVTTVFGVFLGFEAWAGADPILGLAAAFIGACGWAGFRKAARRSRLVLHGDGSATLAVRTLSGLDRRRFSPGTLRAGVETRRDTEGESHRAVLLIDAEAGVERLPFTAHFSGGARARRTVEAIRDWRGLLT